MASAPSKLATAAVTLVALWVVAYWLTPGPADPPLKISIGSAPHEAPAGRTLEAGLGAPGSSGDAEARGAPVDPPVAPAGRSRPVTPGELVDVGPEELVVEGQGADERRVIPPTFQRYVTEQGDTFQRIAARFYGATASWRVIAKSNPEVDPNRVRPGIELMLPVDPQNIQGKVVGGNEDGATPRVIVPEHGAFTEYVVQRGDTLSDIAKSLYGRATLWQLIVDANPGLDPNRLKPGTTLMIPPPPAAE